MEGELIRESRSRSKTLPGGDIGEPLVNDCVGGGGLENDAIDRSFCSHSTRHTRRHASEKRLGNGTLRRCGRCQQRRGRSLRDPRGGGNAIACNVMSTTASKHVFRTLLWVMHYTSRIPPRDTCAYVGLVTNASSSSS